MGGYAPFGDILCPAVYVSTVPLTPHSVKGERRARDYPGVIGVGASVSLPGEDPVRNTLALQVYPRQHQGGGCVPPGWWVDCSSPTIFTCSASHGV